MRYRRRKARVIHIGKIAIGGKNAIAIQSMVKVKTSDVEKVISQIKDLERCGCQIIRLAVKDMLDAKSISKIKRAIKIPLVADIHFNWRLAIEAIEQGSDKIRLNPGNIYKSKEVYDVVSCAKMHRIPIRVGLNSGSLRGHSSRSQAMEMVRVCLAYIRDIEKMKFHDLVISLKASNILETIEAYRTICTQCDYPLHLGVTATGSPYTGAIKSAVAIGALLLEGIGDTLRISLTDTPEQEIIAAKSILGALELRRFGPEVISCPTCGRCEVDLIKIVSDLEGRLSATSYELSTKPVKIAVMGCVVNGPGEAKEADIGVAFGSKEGLLFKHGKPVKKVTMNNCVETLLRELKRTHGQPT